LFEVRNTLIVSERRGRLTESDTATFLRGLAHLRVSVDRSPVEADVLALARHRCLTVYDSAYLELVRREGAPLATLDAALATAARAERVRLLSEPRQSP
jgi:predicted nucleic acid-binding protein